MDLEEVFRLTMRRSYIICTLAALWFAALSIHAQRTGKVTIGDGEAEYDTLLHRHIAPGATLTQFQFNKIKSGNFSYKMKVHLVTVDITNPYNSFSPYLAKDEFYNVSKQNTEIKNRKAAGMKPVVSMTGGGFVQSNGNLTYNTAYEVGGSLVQDGKILYENSSAKRTLYVDNGVHIGIPKFNASVTHNGQSYAVGQVNHHRDHYDGAEMISLFCNGVPKSASSEAQKNKGVDVKVRIKNADHLGVGSTVCEVIDMLDGCCHSLNKDEAILSGVGKAEAFLRSMNVGDEVTVSLGYKDDRGNSLDIKQQVTQLFNEGITDGVIRPSSMTNYAICVLGSSADGRTLYMCDLEISDSSNASVQILLEFLQAIGIDNVVSLDGGPSAEMTVDGEFITTNSIGNGFNGRYIPAGLILYSTAPDDANITSIECTNMRELLMSKGDTYTPQLYAFNQYGEMIYADAKTSDAIEITCTQDIGHISDGHTFVAENNGSGSITIKVKSTGYTITIPVTVTDNRSLQITPHFVFTGEGRECQLGVSMVVNGNVTELDPDDVEWETNNQYVIKSVKGGLVSPFVDGYAEVYAEYLGLKDTVVVKVENLEEDVDQLDMTQMLTDGMISNIHLQSVPYAFSIDLFSDINDTISVVYKTGDAEHVITYPVNANEPWNCSVTLDRSAIDTYPVTLVSATGSGNVSCTGIKAYYSLTGDMDKDGDIDYNDMALLLTYYLQQDSGSVPPIADIDKDGRITIADITWLMDMILYK